MKENIIHDKSYAFALRILRLSQSLTKEHKEYVLSQQILRSGFTAKDHHFIQGDHGPIAFRAFRVTAGNFE